MTDKIDKKAEIKQEKNIVGVRFFYDAKTYFYDAVGIEFLQNGTKVIANGPRGVEYGTVVMLGDEVKLRQKIQDKFEPLIRKGTKDDFQAYLEIRKKEKDAFNFCTRKVEELKLEMKLIYAYYTFDKTKLIFYFSADERVDFRELVKILATKLHTRIEMHQVGVRDRARILNGIGSCGRELCCSRFLKDFTQVSTKMAKRQDLGLNSGKISGCCGKLMCCLKYEDETYQELIKNLPEVGSKIKSKNGESVVISRSTLKQSYRIKHLDNNTIEEICL
ncbi:PSP1 domain-containing protein [Treponema sp. R6D11]